MLKTRKKYEFVYNFSNEKVVFQISILKDFAIVLLENVYIFRKKNFCQKWF